MAGVKILPITSRIFERFITNTNTRAKYRMLVSKAGVPNMGPMAISCVTAAVRGEGKLMDMV